MKVIVALLLLLPVSVFAESWLLSEDSLKSEIKKSNPDLLRIEESLQRARYGDLNLREKYQLQWVSEVSYQNSREKAIASFIPTFGPTYYFATGLQKQFASGIELEGTVFSDQQSTSDKFIDEATRSGIAMSFSVDLWKNFLGRVERAELDDSRFLVEKQKLQTEVNRRVVELELRKLYWSIVANDLKISISKELLKTSLAQLAEGKRRKKQHIADAAEISRYQAQVASRRATIDGFRFQKDLLLQSLKEQLPGLSEKEIKLGPYDISKKIAEVLICSESLKAQKSTPWKSTKWDEILELVEKSYQKKKIINNRYSDIDLQLVSSLQISGVDQGYSDSLDDFTNNGEAGYEVGLTLTMPLGSTQKKAKEAKTKADYQSFLAEKKSLMSQAEVRHRQIVSLVSILQGSIVSLRENSGHLEASIRASKKKFQQARISLNDFISEQDALLNSRLSEVDTQLQAMHTLLDYFQTFTESPCTINQISERGA